MNTINDEKANASILTERLEAVEREIICEALRQANGNKAKAARALGITERIIGLRVVKYSIDPSQFRTAR